MRLPCSLQSSVPPLIFGLQCSAVGRLGIHLSCFRQLSGCWHCCLPLDVSPTPSRTRFRLLREHRRYLLHCFHAAQRVLNQLLDCTSSSTGKLYNVCSRSTQGSVCQRVHREQTTADLLLLDGCSSVHGYRKQETEVQF